MIGSHGLRDRPGLRTMILRRLYWDTRKVCNPLFLSGLVLDAALVIYDGWFRLPKRVRGIHRNTEEHVQQVNLNLSFYSAAAAAADYLATNFLDDFPFRTSRALGSDVCDARFGQERLTEAVRGESVRTGVGQSQRICSRWTWSGARAGGVFGVGAAG